MTRLATTLLFLAAATLLWSGCSPTSRVTSQAPVVPIVLDGSTDEWGGRLMRVEDGLASIGVQNDRETVYVAFVTHDRGAVQKIITTGFTVWLDAGGGKEKRLGIRFPLGMDLNEGRGPVATGEGALPDPHSGQGGPLEVIGEDGRPGRYGADQASGIRVRARIEPDNLMYELAVDRNLIGPTGVLGVGFETPEIEGLRGGDPSRGGTPLGEVRQGRSSSDDPGLRGVRGVGGAGRIPERLNIWARVSLVN